MRSMVKNFIKIHKEGNISYRYRFQRWPGMSSRASNFILSSKLVQPSWHVFVELSVIKFSMLIHRTAVQLLQLEQNTKIIEFKLL